MHWTVNLRSAPGGGGSQAAVAVGNEVYSFGGNASESPYINVHVFNTLSLRWKKLPPVATRRGEPPLDVPCVRINHTAALVESTVYLFGGLDMSRATVCCNMLYAFDVDAHTWFKPRVSGTVPDWRYNHSACVLEKVMFIYGGRTQLTGGTNDMYKLDTTTMIWTLINTRDTAPSTSWGHSVTIIGTKIFVFGGRTWGGYYKDIRVFDTETNLWKNAPPAQILRRYGHSAFTRNGELYIYGGPYFNHPSDLWKFNPETFSWKEVKPKGNGPSTMTSGCCCMVGDRVILCGNYTRPHDLCVLDLNPSLKTLCKLAVIQYGLDQSEHPHNIRCELRAMNETK